MASSMSAETDAIIRHRVLTHDSEFLSLVKKYHAYSTALQRYHSPGPPPSSSSAASSPSPPPPTQAELAELHQRLLHDVDLLSFTLSRTSAVHASLDRELLAYSTTKRSVLSSIASLQAELASLKLRLADAELARRHREQYDALSGQIHELDSRDDSGRTIAELERDIAGLEDEERRLREDEDRKRKSFGLLMTAMRSVKDDWERGEATAAEVQATAAAVSAAAQQHGGGAVSDGGGAMAIG